MEKTEEVEWKQCDVKDGKVIVVLCGVLFVSLPQLSISDDF